MRTTNWSPMLSILKLGGLLVVGLGTSVLGGCFGFFSDIGRTEGPLERALYVWAFFLLGGLYIGIALPRLWYLAIAIAWMPILWIFGAFRIASEAAAYNKNAWWIVINTTFVSPVVALVSGYLGSRIQRGLHPERAKQAKYLRYIYVTLYVALLTVPPLVFLSLFTKVLVEEYRSPGLEYGGMGEAPYMIAARPPLHIAAEAGDLIEIGRLIEQGEDINLRDAAGRTPLHYAVGGQHLAVVELLLLQGANPDIKDYEFGVTPLHWAAASGNLEMVKLLAPRMKNLDVRNKDNETPADIASFEKHEAVVTFLASLGAEVITGD